MRIIKFSEINIPLKTLSLAYITLNNAKEFLELSKMITSDDYLDEQDKEEKESFEKIIESSHKMVKLTTSVIKELKYILN